MLLNIGMKKALLRKHNSLLAVIILGVLFFGVYSWYYSGNTSMFTSPDETANNFFIDRFARTSELTLYEPLNQVVSSGIVRPRSTAYVDGVITSGSFVGMIIIYGLIAKVFSVGVIPFLTPFFAVLGAVTFFLLIRELFGKKIALISYILLITLPPFWYYSSRGMFHNVLFVSLLIIGLYLLVSQLRHNRNIVWYAGSGLCIGLAIFVRASEFVTIMIPFLFILILHRKRIQYTDMIALCIPIVGVVILILIINNTLYGSPLSFSYSQAEIQLGSISVATQSLWSKIKQLFLPFGFDVRQMTFSVGQYLLQIFIYLTIPLVAGLLVFMKQIVLLGVQSIKIVKHPGQLHDIQISPVRLWYTVGYLLMGVWLICYYGSFVFSEYIDEETILFGSSYLRYWLPLYVFGLPLIVFGIVRIGAAYMTRITRAFTYAIFCFVFVYVSFSLTIGDDLQGLSKLQADRQNNLTLQEDIVRQTEEHAVIISGYIDKVIFPKRSVIVRLPSDDAVAASDVRRLQEQTQVYYVHNALDSISTQQMKSLRVYGYVFSKVYQNPHGPEVLYKVL